MSVSYSKKQSLKKILLQTEPHYGSKRNVKSEVLEVTKLIWSFHEHKNSTVERVFCSIVMFTSTFMLGWSHWAWGMRRCSNISKLFHFSSSEVLVILVLRTFHSFPCYFDKQSTFERYVILLCYILIIGRCY